MQLKAKNFNLKHTLESGQFFRYKKTGDNYYIVTHDKFFKIAQREGNLEFDGANKKFVQKFLGLEQDFETIKKHILTTNFTISSLDGL